MTSAPRKKCLLPNPKGLILAFQPELVVWDGMWSRASEAVVLREFGAEDVWQEAL